MQMLKLDQRLIQRILGAPVVHHVQMSGHCLRCNAQRLPPNWMRYPPTHCIFSRFCRSRSPQAHPRLNLIAPSIALESECRESMFSALGPAQLKPWSLIVLNHLLQRNVELWHCRMQRVSTVQPRPLSRGCTCELDLADVFGIIHCGTKPVICVSGGCSAEALKITTDRRCRMVPHRHLKTRDANLRAPPSG